MCNVEKDLDKRQDILFFIQRWKKGIEKIIGMMIWKYFFRALILISEEISKKKIESLKYQEFRINFLGPIVDKLFLYEAQ